MTKLRDWQMAFLKQARVDWEAYHRTHQTRWPDCHRLLFLQMATEKLGKALLLAGHSKLERLTRSHAAFVKFMQVASYNRNLQTKLSMTPSQLKVHFNRLLPIAYEIEILAPALAQDGPNPEYPWLDKAGRIQVPMEYTFPLVKSLQTSHGLQLLKHIANCIAEFEKLFLS
jgi:hypothetical protein